MCTQTLRDIKNRIASERKQCNFTQEDMAKTLNISQPAYSYYEKGTKPIPLDKLKIISEILSLPLVELIGDFDEEDQLSKIATSLERIADALEQLVQKSS